MVTLAFQASFVRYYESVVDPIVTAYGPPASWRQWPEVLRFGRFVRAAFAHDGVVALNDPSAPDSTWRGLTYGPNQKARQVLYGDLALADVIVLMEEMDDAIPR